MATNNQENRDVVLVVGSKIKDVVRDMGCQSSGELVQAVSDKVYDLVKAACSRAQENGRKTVRAHDL